MKAYQECLPKYLQRIQEGYPPLEAAWSALWGPNKFVSDQMAKDFLKWVNSP